MSTNNFDVMCPSETYINSSVPNNDGNLEITGYNLHRANSSSNTKRGGVYNCYKNYLPLKIVNIKHRQECVIFE